MYSEIAITKRASATLRSSSTGATNRSLACAVKLNGMPVSRCTTQAAVAGWLAKCAWTWSTRSRSATRATATAFGEHHGLLAASVTENRSAPRSTAASVDR